MSIDHVSIRVADFDASRRFYDAVLAPLGLEALVVDDPPFAEWGDFSIFADGAPLSANVHVAFGAVSREQVEAFHAAGAAATRRGGTGRAG